MKLLHIDELIIPEDRQRKVFNPESLGELSASIVSKGLMQALVVRNDGKTLVAGERRSKAIKLAYTMNKTFEYSGEQVPPDHIPVVCLGELTPDEVYEAELEENIRRDNLTPQEEMLAIARLHELRMKQDPEHTMRATAAEIHQKDSIDGSAVTEVRNAQNVAEHLNDPAVAKAKTKKEAVNAVNKILARKHAAKLASEFTASAAEETPHVPVQGDAVSVLKRMPSGIVDVVCADPPYGIGANSFGSMADKNHEYDDTESTWKELMPVVAEESFRVAKAHAHLYMFCDWTRFNELSAMLRRAGWDVWTRPLIWAKGNGMLPKPDEGPRYTYEVILFANKGRRKTLGVYPDVLNYKAVTAPRHAAEKPVDVIADLIQRSANPGDHVLDMFMGSGTIFPAANRCKVRATGIELNDVAYGQAIQRLEEK